MNKVLGKLAFQENAEIIIVKKPLPIIPKLKQAIVLQTLGCTIKSAPFLLSFRWKDHFANIVHHWLEKHLSLALGSFSIWIIRK